MRLSPPGTRTDTALLMRTAPRAQRCVRARPMQAQRGSALRSAQRVACCQAVVRANAGCHSESRDDRGILVAVGPMRTESSTTRSQR